MEIWLLLTCLVPNFSVSLPQRPFLWLISRAVRVSPESRAHAFFSLFLLSPKLHSCIPEPEWWLYLQCVTQVLIIFFRLLICSQAMNFLQRNDGTDSREPPWKLLLLMCVYLGRRRWETRWLKTYLLRLEWKAVFFPPLCLQRFLCLRI